MTEAKRRYLPAEAYRLLVLAALAWRRAPASKGDLAWETRANHYMATRVLRDLAEEGLVAARRRDDGAYAVELTDEGRAFFERNRDYLRRTFRRGLEEHFRYGRPPPWLHAALSADA